MTGEQLGFRSAAAGYLGDLPAGWGVRRLGSLLIERKEIVGESAANYRLLSLTLKGVIPRDVVNIKGKMPADFGTYQVVKRGDLVFCLFDVEETPRTVGLASETGMVTGAYTVMRSVDANVSIAFLEYVYLSYDQRKALRPLYAGLRNTLRSIDFRNVLVPFPRVEMQAAIVSYLDRETAAIDVFIADQEELIGLLSERRAATITHAVTKGLDPSVATKDSGFEWIGRIPASWEIRKLRDLFALIGSGTTPPRDEGDSFYGGDVPWVTTGELRESRVLSTRETVTAEALRRLSALRIYPVE